MLAQRRGFPVLGGWGGVSLYQLRGAIYWLSTLIGIRGHPVGRRVSAQAKRKLWTGQKEKESWGRGTQQMGRMLSAGWHLHAGSKGHIPVTLV